MQLSDAETIKKCVVYVGYRKVSESRIRGTAFFVTHGGLGYLVTAKHNILGAKRAGVRKLLIRFNTKDGSAGELESDLNAWKLHGDSFTDVAVLRITDEIESNKMDVEMYQASNHVTDETIKNMPVTVGDEVFVPGLFSQHAGKVRNVPIVRAGNIAAMAVEPVPIVWVGNTRTEIDAYLIEARSLGGLSGAPVFVHFPERRRYGEAGSGQKVITMVRKATEHALLGLVHGHYDERIPRKGTPKYINAGIAIVVPFTKVMELLEQQR